MALKLTYGKLRDRNFGRAFGKVAGYAGYKSPAVAINLAKINKKLLEEAEIADEQHLALVKQYAQLDEKGEVVADDKGTWKPKDDAAQKEFEAKLKEFNAVEFEVPGALLRVEDIMAAGVSPLDLSFLDEWLAPVLEAVKPS